MQSVTIEKGQHLTLRINAVEEVPSKNPSWDSRWKVSGMCDGAAVCTFIGNKAMTQQLGRKGIASPDNIVGETWTFERTVEGYFNLIPAGGKTKTEAVSVASAPAPAPAPAKPMPFDEPVDGEDDPAEAMARKQEEIRQEKRKRVGEDIAWAFTQADHFVTLAIQAHKVEYTPDVLRSVVALAATIHISYKEAR